MPRLRRTTQGRTPRVRGLRDEPSGLLLSRSIPWPRARTARIPRGLHPRAGQLQGRRARARHLVPDGAVTSRCGHPRARLPVPGRARSRGRAPQGDPSRAGRGSYRAGRRGEPLGDGARELSEEQKPEQPTGPARQGDPERTERMDQAGESSRDWSSFEGDIERRVRDARRARHEQAREAERMARESERMAREADRMARDTERQVHESMRERMRESRERDREARREERQARREEWRGRRHVHIETDIPGGAAAFGFGAGDFAKRFMKDFVSDATGDSYSETLNGEFLFDRMPRLRIRNVSGETRIKVGDVGKITVVAKKQVTAGSEDRAKRLLQNLEIRMEKSGDELRIEPHLYEQERSWVDLFRGKRFRVDFDITVPQECGLDAQTVSGDVVASGLRGPMDVQAVSGEITLEDTRGPLRLKSVSGDVAVRRYVGHVEGNTVSGDITFDAVRIRSAQLHTVSGDVDLKGVLEAAREHRFRTISGDI